MSSFTTAFHKRVKRKLGKGTNKNLIFYRIRENSKTAKEQNY